MSNALGNLLAAGLGTVLTTVLTRDHMTSWGWRIPFLLGTGLACYAYVLRRRMTETHPARAPRRRDGRVDAPADGRSWWKSARDTRLRHPGALVRVVGYTLAGTIVYYTWVVFLPSYAAADGNLTASAALLATTLAQLLFVIALPLAGLLADRVGTKPLLIVFAASFAVLTVPLQALAPRSFGWLLGIECLGLILFCGYGATAPLVMAEQFSADARATGIGVPYGLTVSLFGGTAPYLAAAAGHSGHSSLYASYVALACVVSLGFFVRLAGRR